MAKSNQTSLFSASCQEDGQQTDKEPDRQWLSFGAGAHSATWEDLCGCILTAGVTIIEWDIPSDTLVFSKNQNNGQQYLCAQISSCTEAVSGIHPDDMPTLRTLLKNIRQGWLYTTAQLRLFHEDSGYMWHRIHMITLRDGKGREARAVGQIINIHPEMNAMDKLRLKAETDALTGVLNREQTQLQIMEYLRGNPAGMSALFVIDMDNFKQINETHGHMLGDVVLTEIASVMKRLAGRRGVVGRIGGDEFVIFMKNVKGSEEAEESAEDLQKEFRSLFQNEKLSLLITSSIGIALYPRDGTGYKELFNHGDEALYHAKMLGKDRYYIYRQAHDYQDTASSGMTSSGTQIDSDCVWLVEKNEFLTRIFKYLYTTEDTDLAINTILEIVGRRFDVSRAYVFESSEDGKTASNTYEWCNMGIRPKRDNLQNIEYSAMGNYQDLYDENSLFYCRDISKLKPEQKALFESQNICSVLQCAFWSDEKFAGFIGFDECTGLRLWTREEVDVLSLISQMMTTFIQRRRAMTCNQEMEDQLRIIEDERKRLKGEVGDSEKEDIVECIERLSSAEHSEDAVGYVLDVLKGYYRADRVYVIEMDEGEGRINPIFETCAEEIQPYAEVLRKVPFEEITFWVNQFKSGGYIRIDDVESLREIGQREYELLRKRGIASLMALPFYAKGEICGFLGMDNPKNHQDDFHYLKGLCYLLENEIIKNVLNRKLNRMSRRDSLTGLENRKSYMEYCDDFFQQNPVPTGIIFININGLKRINDAKGHMYGDMLIMRIAEMMEKSFPEDRKFRLSGNEFLVVTRSVDYELFCRSLEAMKTALYEDGRCIIAVGTTWSEVQEDLPDLVHKAERLMQINKTDYYKLTDQLSSEKMPLLKGLTESIRNKQFLVYLQPKLNLKTGRVDSAEVLIRYREENGSISAPARFIPLLESEGLISNIDFFVMEEVCRLLTRWKGTPLSKMKLALNFSRITLFDDGFLDQFLAIFHRYRLDPGQLEVEVTETQETLNKKQMILLLKELGDLGFSIALDDFGIDYSSYDFLMMADLNLLKIDKEIIQKFGEISKAGVLLRHIVEMSHDIGVMCCAEGVETQEQYRYVKEIGCDYIQGYLISKPIPAEQFEAVYRYQ